MLALAKPQCKFSPETGGCWSSCPWDSSVSDNGSLSKSHSAILPPESQSSTAVGFLSAAGLSTGGIHVSAWRQGGGS